jgi:DNA-binding MarR family transcriptional regulator
VIYARIAFVVNSDVMSELAAAAEFRSALRAFLRRTVDASSANGLTPQRYDLLLQIRARSPDAESTVTELAERLSLPQPAVTELVNRAELAGLVRRRRHPEDGRVTRLTLTAKGERRLLATFEELRGGRQALLDAFEHAARSLRTTEPAPPRRRANLKQS